MSAGTEKSPLNFVAGEDLEAHRAVRLHDSTANTVVYADAGERAIGVTLVRADSGGMVAVEMLAAAHTLKVTAAGSISANAVVYTANDGKVSDSVSGEPIGKLRTAGVADQESELIPYGMAGGDTDTDLVRFSDDFFFFNLDESGSEGFWVLDANDSGGVTIEEEHGGVITLAASDGTAADNDESYIVSLSELFKPAAGANDGDILGIFEARVKLTEANTDDASITFGLHGGDTVDVENFIADGGATIQDSGQSMAFLKSDGGTVYKGVVRDSALDTDSDVGAFSDGNWQKLRIVVSDADTSDGSLEVEFFVDGVSGGSLDYALASATEMRLILGVKNGDTNAETLKIDKVYAEFKR